MLLSNKKVAIIGGGPGGLTLARLLQLQSVDVKVYEWDFNADVRVQGATLDLHQHSGLKAIRAADLWDQFIKTYRPGADKSRIVDKFGHIIFDERENADPDNFTSPYFRPEIDRGPLRNLLLASLAPDTVVWDSQLLTLSENGNGWQMEFKNGSRAIADLVIGADGVNSKTRPFVTDTKISYAGVTIVQGNVANAAARIPEIVQLLEGGKANIFSDQKFLHISAKGDGSVDFYLSGRKPESWSKDHKVLLTDPENVITWFKEEIDGWDELWLSLARHTDLPLLLRPQYVIPADQTWDAKSNITLLGDAAHIMPPSGEGVNLAMLDAVELADALTGEGFEDIRSAVAFYEKSMLQRSNAESVDAMEMTAWMHSDRAVAEITRMLG